ncbi:MAG: hypothetical protein WC003_10210, partial [Terrimicrobiaceae bacterium]
MGHFLAEAGFFSRWWRILFFLQVGHTAMMVLALVPAQDSRRHAVVGRPLYPVFLNWRVAKAAKPHKMGIGIKRSSLQ